MSAPTIEVEVRCRVPGLDGLSEDALAELMEAAAVEAERRVSSIGPVVFADGEVLGVLGSFEPVASPDSLAGAEAFARELSGALRAALQRREIVELTTSLRELTAA